MCVLSRCTHLNSNSGYLISVCYCPSTVGSNNSVHVLHVVHIQKKNTCTCSSFTFTFTFLHVVLYSFFFENIYIFFIK